MAIFLYHYLCVNPQCRSVEIRSGVRYSQIECGACGGLMRLIKTEKRDSGIE